MKKYLQRVTTLINLLFGCWFDIYVNIKYSRYGYSYFKITINGLSVGKLLCTKDYSTAFTIFDKMKNSTKLEYETISLQGYYYPLEKWECIISAHRFQKIATLDATGKIPLSYLPLAECPFEQFVCATMYKIQE